VNVVFSVPGDGWSNFYKRYPGAHGILSFSRIGLNKRKDQALLGVGNQASDKMGAGNLVLLAEKNGTWAVVKEAMLWVS